jgi:hypothetical protein
MMVAGAFLVTYVVGYKAVSRAETPVPGKISLAIGGGFSMAIEPPCK